jgi:hypothetical protein
VSFKALPCLAFSERRDFFGHLLYSSCFFLMIFTWVPSTSTTSTFMMKTPSLTGFRKGGALGSDDPHELVL